MNYAQLVAEIQSYTENQFEVADINTFIEQAEQRIYNSVLAAPSDWLATFSLAVIDSNSNYTYLLDKDVNFIREAYRKSTDTGLPIYYALFDQNTFILGPTPDTAYSMELHYYYYPASIVVAGTTWLGDNFDSTLLYGALLEAYTYMKGEADVLANYKARYDEAMFLLKQLGDGKNRRDAYRNGQVRVPVV